MTNEFKRDNLKIYLPDLFCGMDKEYMLNVIFEDTIQKLWKPDVGDIMVTPTGNVFPISGRNGDLFMFGGSVCTDKDGGLMKSTRCSVMSESGNIPEGVDYFVSKRECFRWIPLPHQIGKQAISDMLHSLVEKIDEGAKKYIGTKELVEIHLDTVDKRRNFLKMKFPAVLRTVRLDCTPVEFSHHVLDEVRKHNVGEEFEREMLSLSKLLSVSDDSKTVFGEIGFLSGLELISMERKRHKYSLDDDAGWENRQLMKGAYALLKDSLIHRLEERPYGWDEHKWEKMSQYEYRKRLIISGSLLCAELDRISKNNN